MNILLIVLGGAGGAVITFSLQGLAYQQWLPLLS